MIAAWYDRQGPPAEVLQVGELPTAEPGPGEVRVRLTRSGANPGDIKKPSVECYMLPLFGWGKERGHHDHHRDHRQRARRQQPG